MYAVSLLTDCGSRRRKDTALFKKACFNTVNTATCNKYQRETDKSIYLPVTCVISVKIPNNSWYRNKRNPICLHVHNVVAGHYFDKSLKFRPTSAGRQSMWAERERSGKRSGATRKSGGAERSGEREWEKNSGAKRSAERSAEREVAEREQSVERAELAAHSPLQRNISLIS